MQEKQRGMESQNALNRAMSSAYNQKTGQYDQSEVYRQLATGGQGHLIPGQMESDAKLNKAKNDSQKAQTDLLGSRMKQFRDFYSTNVRTPNQMRQFNAASAKDPVIGKFLEEQGITLDQLNQEINDVEAAGPEAVNQYRLQQVLDADKFINANKSTVHFPPGSDKAYVSYQDGRIEEVAGLNTGASQRITPYQQGQQDVANRNLGFREREVALKEKEAARREQPSAQKPLTQQQEIKLRGDVGKDYKSASTTISQMDDILDSIKAVKDAPGLSAATGYTGKYLPSFSEGKAAQAETRLQNLKGKTTALGKAVASMSGSIGSIATKEWEIISNQIANIDPVKGKGPLLEQIDLIENQAIGAINRIKDVYEKTRGEDFERFPQFQNLPESRVLKAKNSQQPAAPGRPSNVDQAVWNVMTPEERALFANPNP